MIAGAVAAAIALACGVGFVYVHNHSASALAHKAEVAFGQHDFKGAVNYASQSVRKNPAGELGIGVRNLLTRALIEDGREEDARPYAEDVLKMDPSNSDAMENVAETYVHPAFRRYRTAMRPLTVQTCKELFGVIGAGISGLEKLPRTARDVVAEAELQRLYHVIDQEGRRQAQRALDAATAAGDQTAMNQAREDLGQFTEAPGARKAKAVELLNEAWKLDPKDPRPPKLLAQYAYQDQEYGDALKVYEAVKQAGGEKAVSQELAIVTANVLMADSARQGDKEKRFAEAQGVLEG
jgi:tetratricopeptide (TPR) repeat protein